MRALSQLYWLIVLILIRLHLTYLRWDYHRLEREEERLRQIIRDCDREILMEQRAESYRRHSMI